MTKYSELRAAMMLACPNVTWWAKPVTVEGHAYIVPMMAKGDVPKAVETLKAYGINGVEQVRGSSFELLPIATSRLELDMPVRICSYDPKQDDSEHAKWKGSVINQLNALGVVYCAMEYSGSGDSGNPDDFLALLSGEERWYARHNDGRAKAFEAAQAVELPDDLTSEISEYCWDTLVQHDCVNNEGGGGSLVFDLTGDTPNVLFSCYTNETIQHQHENDEPV